MIKYEIHWNLPAKRTTLRTTIRSARSARRARSSRGSSDAAAEAGARPGPLPIAGLPTKDQIEEQERVLEVALELDFSTNFLGRFFGHNSRLRASVGAVFSWIALVELDLVRKVEL